MKFFQVKKCFLSDFVQLFAFRQYYFAFSSLCEAVVMPVSYGFLKWLP